MIYPAIILHNTATGRFHPLVFRPGPSPSDDDPDCYRFKSLGHHTEGFATHSEAVADCDTEKVFGQDILYVEGLDQTWDGKDLPARIMRFSVSEVLACVKKRKGSTNLGT